MIAFVSKHQSQSLIILGCHFTQTLSTGFICLQRFHEVKNPCPDVSVIVTTDGTSVVRDLTLRVGVSNDTPNIVIF